MPKITKYSELRHGMRVKCEITDTYIDDAKLSIDDNGNVWICQNERDGCDAVNKLNYRYSWFLTTRNRKKWADSVEDLESVEEPESGGNKSIK